MEKMFTNDEIAILGTNIVFCRKAYGWSQRDLEKRTGVSRKTINEVEQGRIIPKMQTLLDIISVFHIPLPILFDPDFSKNGDIVELVTDRIIKDNDDNYMLVTPDSNYDKLVKAIGLHIVKNHRKVMNFLNSLGYRIQFNLTTELFTDKDNKENEINEIVTLIDTNTSTKQFWTQLIEELEFTEEWNSIDRTNFDYKYVLEEASQAKVKNCLYLPYLTLLLNNEEGYLSADKLKAFPMEVCLYETGYETGTKLIWKKNTYDYKLWVNKFLSQVNNIIKN